MKTRRWLVLVSVGMGLLLSLGCVTTTVNRVAVGTLETKTETVELNDAASVRADIRMGAGMLRVDGGAESLMEAEFIYNVSSWEPQVEYRVSDGVGRLTVRQPNSDQMGISSDVRYEWDLAFDEQAPLDLRLNMGAGQAELNLSDLAVTRLDLKLGAGDVAVDLGGNETLQQLDADVGAGQLVLDLRGDWRENLTVIIQGGVGRTELRLPETVGVKVTLTQGLGEITTSGLTRSDDSYVNAAYGVADVTLDITIRAGIGSIELKGE